MRLMRLAIPFLLLLIGGCEKKRICEEPDQNFGLIMQSVSNLCLPALGSKTFVIRNESSFRLLFPSDECAKRLDIDFKKYSLLGFLVTGQGCTVRFKRELRVESESFQYVYEITPIICGKCKEESTSYNWVIVPRLLSDWNVRFVEGVR